MDLDYVNLLGAGAGFDTKALVSALVEAERAPKSAAVNKKIDATSLELSGISQALSTLEELRTSALTLNDQSDFNSFAVTNTQTSSLTVTATGAAMEANHSIGISSLASEKRMISGAFSRQGETINSGVGFDLTITIGSSSPVAHTVSVSSAASNPAGVVSAINDAGLGVTAELVQTGTSSSYKIQLIGATGSENTFSVTAPPSDLSFTATKTAADAQLTVDGVTFTRESNTFSDVITGANISLHATTDSNASVSFNNDRAAVKTKLMSFVDQANTSLAEFKSMLKSESGGELSSNFSYKKMHSDIVTLITGASSTSGSTITRLGDLGIRLARDGTLEVDEPDLDTAISSNFAEITKIFSADTENQTETGDAARGIAGDLSKFINDLSSSTGYFTTRTATLEGKASDYADDLTELEERLARLQERYTKQFSAMQTVINEMNTLRDSLTSTFENLPYTKQD